jgi:PEP-CTERM motif
MLSKSFIAKPLAVAALMVLAGTSQAAITVYTTQASYLAAITAPGVDTFNDLTIASTPSPLTRTAGAYSYTAAASTSTFFPAGSSGDIWLSTNLAGDSITFSGFSSAVRGVGGLFFGSDIAGAFAAGSVTLTATDASGSVTQTITGATTSSFLGFVSTGAFTSVSISAISAATPLWPTVNNLTLGAAAVVPEPETYALMMAGLGLVSLVARRRRRG